MERGLPAGRGELQEGRQGCIRRGETAGWGGGYRRGRETAGERGLQEERVAGREGDCGRGGETAGGKGGCRRGGETAGERGPQEEGVAGGEGGCGRGGGTVEAASTRGPQTGGRPLPWDASAAHLSSLAPSLSPQMQELTISSPPQGRSRGSWLK